MTVLSAPLLETRGWVCLAELDVRLLFGMWEFRERVPRWPNHITGAILCVKLSLSIWATTLQQRVPPFFILLFWLGLDSDWAGSKWTHQTGKNVGPPQRRVQIICLQLVLVRVWMKGTSLGAFVSTDLFTLTHMSNLILVSCLNWCHVSDRPICHTGWCGNHVQMLREGG